MNEEPSEDERRRAALLYVSHLRAAFDHVREAVVQLEAIVGLPDSYDEDGLPAFRDLAVGDDDPVICEVYEAARAIAPLPQKLLDAREELARRHRIASKEYMSPQRWVRG
jgi:hypothetical protein